MRRGFPTPALLALMILGTLAGCSKSWTQDQQQEFVSGCMKNLQLADMQKKQAICECWFDKASTEYSYDTMKKPTPEMGRVFIQWGKECSAAQGLTATIARPQAPAPEGAAAASGGEPAQPPPGAKPAEPAPGAKPAAPAPGAKAPGDSPAAAP